MTYYNIYPPRGNHVPMILPHLILFIRIESQNTDLLHNTRNIPDLYEDAIEITPIPTVDELNAHVWGEEFHACVIEKAEFEAIWESRFYSGAF